MRSKTEISGYRFEMFGMFYEDISRLQYVSYSAERGEKSRVKYALRSLAYSGRAKCVMHCSVMYTFIDDDVIRFVVYEERLRLAYRKVVRPDQDRPFVFSPPRATDSSLPLFKIISVTIVQILKYIKILLKTGQKLTSFSVQLLANQASPKPVSLTDPKLASNQNSWPVTC